MSHLTEFCTSVPKQFIVFLKKEQTSIFKKVWVHNIVIKKKLRQTSYNLSLWHEEHSRFSLTVILSLKMPFWHCFSICWLFSLLPKCRIQTVFSSLNHILVPEIRDDSKVIESRMQLECSSSSCIIRTLTTSAHFLVFWNAIFQQAIQFTLLQTSTATHS